MGNRLKIVQAGWEAFTGEYAGVSFTAGLSDYEVSAFKENLIAAQMRVLRYIDPSTTAPAGEAGETIDNVAQNPSVPDPQRGSVASFALPFKRIVGTSYTLTSADNGYWLIFLAPSAVAVTVPKGLGAFMCAIRQGGTGQITVVPASGVTLKNADNQFKTEKQNIHLSLMTEELDVFWLDGRTAA